MFILYLDCYHHHMTKYFVKTHRIVNQKEHRTIWCHLYDIFQQAKLIFGKKNQNSSCPWHGDRDWLGRDLRKVLEDAEVNTELPLMTAHWGLRAAALMSAPSMDQWNKQV